MERGALMQQSPFGPAAAFQPRVGALTQVRFPLKKIIKRRLLSEQKGHDSNLSAR